MNNMVEIITGVRTTGSIQQARRVVDMADSIAQLDPNEGPFLSFMKLPGMKTREVTNPKFDWLDDKPVPYAFTVPAGATASATSLTLGEVSTLPVGSMLQNKATGENMLVTAVDAGAGKVTVVRGYGNVAAAAIDANAKLHSFGVAMPENSNSPDPLSTKEDQRFNYTQIFRTTVALSGTEEASTLYGGKDRGYQRKKALVDHKLAIARAMYLGQRKEDLSASTPRRTMGGLKEMLAESGHAAFNKDSAPLTWDTFVKQVAQPAFLHGSSQKVMLTGSNMVNHILSWSTEKLQLTVKENKFGIHIKTLLTPFGTMQIIHDRLLDTIDHSDQAFILDPSEVRYVHLKGRDTKLRLNIKGDDVDGVTDEYLTECSLEVRSPGRHFHVTGVY